MNNNIIASRLRNFLVLVLMCYSLTIHANDNKEIVVLNSYHPGFKWSTDITKAIQDYFENDQNIRLFNDFMDSKRFSSPDYLTQLRQLLKTKYSHSSIDGIICCDNRAFDFYTKYGKQIWGDIPAVFCGVNDILNQERLLNADKHAAVLEQIDITGTLKLIKNLQPDLQEIIVVSDQTLTGKIFTEQFKQVAPLALKEVKYRYILSSDLSTLQSELASITTQNKAIYLLSLYTNRSGVPDEMIKEGKFLFKNINIPIYSNWDFLLNDFIVGGRLIKAYDQGKIAAQLMHQKLNHQTTPLFTAPPYYSILDNNLLQKHNLCIATISENVQIINRTESFIHRHRKQLLIMLVILIVLIFIILLLTNDIIKRKRIELELMKSEKRLDMAMQGANEGLWDADVSNGTIYYNDQFAQLLGYKTAEELDLTINNWSHFVVPEDIEQLREAYEMHVENKLPTFNCEIRVIKKNKQHEWFSIHGQVMSRINQAPSRILGTITNISAQKEFEEQLKKAKEKAEESDRLKSSFLANMSHEIRTPMNAILGFTDLLINGELEQEEQNEFLKLIKSSGENLLNLINDIIDISKIESGEMTINQEEFDLHKMLNELAAVGNSLIQSQNKPISIRIKRDIKDDEFNIHSDPTRIYQVLLNLFSNAIKFTDEGFVEIGYQIISSQKVRFYVKDTGPGISPQNQAIIFDRFRQVDESTVKKHGGTGLGLSITKSITQLLGGEIRLQSEPGKGSQFIVEIPCKIMLPATTS